MVWSMGPERWPSINRGLSQFMRNCRAGSLAGSQKIIRRKDSKMTSTQASGAGAKGFC